MDILHNDFEKITKKPPHVYWSTLFCREPANATGHSEAIGSTTQLLFEREKLADYKK